jgi:hypothetical protein
LTKILKEKLHTAPHVFEKKFFYSNKVLFLKVLNEKFLIVRQLYQAPSFVYQFEFTRENGDISV